MYGMVLESIQYFVQLEYGEKVWHQVVQVAGCKHTVFSTHQVYPDNVMSNLASACAEVTSASYESFMNFFGRCFVRFFSHYGYDVTIKATGRFLTDFLQNVDNIHSQFSFTYPKMKSPSIYLSHIDEDGCVLVYRSSRQGFAQYVIGQLQQIGKDFYGLNLNIRILEQISSATSTKNFFVVSYRLDYNNRPYIAHKKISHLHTSRHLSKFPISLLLDMFPFSIVLNPKMEIFLAGGKLFEFWRTHESFLYQPATRFFQLRRPKGVSFSWKTICNMESIMFELECNRGIIAYENLKDSKRGTALTPGGQRATLLRGQMKYISDANAIIFLCCPVISNLDELTDQGLFLNDLNQHGLSKEMVLAGWQHNSKLEMMFDKAEHRTNELETSYELLDKWKRRGDELLYSMIPKTVADRLRLGHSPLSTCESFECVTILFCELVTGLSSDTVQAAMQVVSTMNTVFTCFDTLMDQFNVYKVETVGQVYMVASGAPERNDSHALNMALLSLEMMKQIKKLNVSIRIGIHSGPVVAGVVGIKVPRYCFFGDTVNTASRMQSTSMPGMINISACTKKLLPTEQFYIKARGIVKIKGKGEMETYWLKNIL